MFEKLAFNVLALNITILKLLLNHKKAIIRSNLIICWFYLYNNNMLTFDRIKIFVFIIIIICIYKIIYNYIERIYKDLRDEAAFYVVRSKYQKYIYIFDKIIYILLFIQKWRNPVLVFLLYIDKKMYNFMRLIYEFLWSYGLKQEIREMFNMLIIYVFGLGTIKVFFGRFYIMLGKWSTLSFIDVFFNRIYGLLISIFIFSDLINLLKIFIITKGLLGCLLIYLSISLILILIELFYIFKIYTENTYYFGRIMLLIRNSLLTYTTIDLAIYHRMHYTILGRIITIISEIILDLEEDDVKFLPNAVVGSFVTCVRFKKGSYILLKYRSRYTYLYMDHISSHFLTRCNYLETTFKTYWEFLKRNYYKGFILIQDRKNYPSAYLFHSLVNSFNALFGPGIKLTEVYYYILKCQKNYIVLNEKETSVLLCLYSFDILRFKIIFYMLWDILEIIDFDIINWIKKFKSEEKDLLKWRNWNVIWDIIEEKEVPNDVTFIKINKEIYRIFVVFHFFKNELEFYDLEKNMTYFTKLFDYIGYVKTDYAYEDADFEYKEMCGRYYISKKLELYSDSLLYLWKNFNIDMGFSRKDDLILSNDYEKVIEVHFKNVLQELRVEWVLLKQTETLEKRNKRLLHELECSYVSLSQV